MNREFPRDSGRPRRSRAPREGVSIKMILLVALTVALFGALATFIFTDVWPFMHEVIWQHSWKPVCDYGHGHLEFCRR